MPVGPPAARGAESGADVPATNVPLVGTEIDAALQLEHRKKGLLWFPTYSIDFAARYSFENPSKERRTVNFELPLEHENALYDGFEVARVGGGGVDASVSSGVARWSDQLQGGEKRTYQVRYRSRGTSRWQYDLTRGTTNVRDFRLTLTTDFDEVDFIGGTLSPTTQSKGDGRWSGTWSFKTLVSSSPIGLELPQKLNPGPVASRITFFAPVSLLFFFFVVAILGQARGKRLHPLHFFFLGCAFFAFHLMFAYLVDHLAIAPAFAISSVVSIALVVSYARLFVGLRFALLEMGVSQLLYLVLFSFTFFFSGFTGLSITIGAVLTLFVLMQLTGRTDPGEADSDPRAACASPYRCAATRDLAGAGRS